MYNPAAFVENRPDVLHRFLRRHPFATLISAGPNGFSSSHVPMLFDEPSNVLRCHVARANPHWQHLQASPETLVLFQGPHHYISPSWYASKQQGGKVVPTWNYTTVHVQGRARIFDDREDLVTLVRQLTNEHEASFEQPWSIDDAPSDYIDAMARSIVGIEISIDQIAGKGKLGQNRSEQDRRSAIEGLERLGTSASLEMAALMRAALEQEAVLP